jgi:hypothetical protein
MLPGLSPRPVNTVMSLGCNSEEVMWLPTVSKNSLPFVIRR